MRVMEELAEDSDEALWYLCVGEGYLRPAAGGELCMVRL